VSLREFIRINRQAIDITINLAVYKQAVVEGAGGRYNDKERRMWIYNDQGLYNAARAAGCKNV
jgi:hypothetical protein